MQSSLKCLAKNANRRKGNIISRARYIVQLGVWVRRSAYKVLVGKPAGKRPISKSGCGWKYNKHYRSGNVLIT